MINIIKHVNMRNPYHGLISNMRFEFRSLSNTPNIDKFQARQGGMTESCTPPTVCHALNVIMFPGSGLQLSMYSHIIQYQGAVECR